MSTARYESYIVIIPVNLSTDDSARVMAQAVSRWPLTAKIRVRSQARSCEIRGFLRVLRFPPPV